MPSVRVVIMSALLCLGCGASDEDETTRLQQFLSGEIELESGEAAELNLAFARSAVRGGGYAQHSALGDEAEYWSPVVRWDGAAWQPADVTPWITAQDIDENGWFHPCQRQACSGDSPEPLIGAATRLFDTRSVEWAESPWGIELGPDAVTRINPRLLELEPEPEQAVAAASTTRLTAAPPLRSHEPPPELDSSDSDGCDCDDFISIDCGGDSSNNTSSNNNCSLAHSRSLPWINLHTLALAAALAWVVRRRPSFAGRLRRVLAALLGSCLLLLTSLPAQASADVKASIEAGKKALLAKDYAAAIRELENARRQGAGTEALAPLAQAYEGAGQLPQAYVALAELGPSGEQRLKKLELELSFVSAQVVPPHAVLSVDGGPVAIDPKSKQIVVTPGPHVLSASADGFAPAEQPFQAERGTRNTVVSIALPQQATIVGRAFAPAAVIAVDGTPVGAGQWTGSVVPGQHLVQVYKPGGPAYDFPISAAPGQTIQLPPPEAPPAPAPAPIRPRKLRLNRGLYILGQLGFFGLTANPDGFEYELVRDDDTGEMRESGGIMWSAGATVGYRLTRSIGVGGLLLYGRGGGEGTVSQVESSSTGATLSHTGPADFTLQFVRVGPHFRFMAGGDVARFLGGVSIGASYQMVDLIHVDVVEQNGVLVERGNFEHNEAGLGPFWGFDLGAEFNPGAHLLLGVALDFYLDRTSGISSDPYGGTAQGYIGFSARVGYHDWKAVD